MGWRLAWGVQTFDSFPRIPAPAEFVTGRTSEVRKDQERRRAVRQETKELRFNDNVSLWLPLMAYLGAPT